MDRYHPRFGDLMQAVSLHRRGQNKLGITRDDAEANRCEGSHTGGGCAGPLIVSPTRKLERPALLRGCDRFLGVRESGQCSPEWLPRC